MTEYISMCENTCLINQIVEKKCADNMCDYHQKMKDFDDRETKEIILVIDKKREDRIYVLDPELGIDIKLLEYVMIDYTTFPSCIINIITGYIDKRKKCVICKERCDFGNLGKCERCDRTLCEYCRKCITEPCKIQQCSYCMGGSCLNVRRLYYCGKCYEKVVKRCRKCGVGVDYDKCSGEECNECEKVYCFKCCVMKYEFSKCYTNVCEDCRRGICRNIYSPRRLCEKCFSKKETDDISESDNDDNNDDEDDYDDIDYDSDSDE